MFLSGNLGVYIIVFVILHPTILFVTIQIHYIFIRQMQNDNTNDYLRLHTGILLAGATGVFGRLISLAELPLVWYRMIIAAAVLAAVLKINRRLSVPDRSQLLRIDGCGVLLAIHWVLFYASIKASNVSIAVVCIALNGFFTAIIEPLTGHRRLSLRELLLSMITLAGILLIFGLDTRHRTGIIIGTFSSLFYTLFSIASKRVQHATGRSSSTMLLYELLAGWGLLTLVLPLYAFLFPSASLLPSGWDWAFIPVFASLFTIGPFLTQLQALRTISAFTVNLSYNLEPLYSILLAMIIFDEGKELNFSFWIGVFMIILSVVLQTAVSKREQDKSLSGEKEK